MKIGLYQFLCSGEIAENLNHIRKAAAEAAAAGVRLLVFPECALCGYPPIESQIGSITPEAIAEGLAQISVLAKEYGLYIAVGTVRFDGPTAAQDPSALQRYNSLVLFDETGTLVGAYDKTALWGWDTEHFTRGNRDGLFSIDGIKIGFRICFDVRFPESFRSLYLSGADLCIIAFSDTAEEPNPERYQIIKAHLITRAVENVMPLLSVNSTSRKQTAPTAAFDRDGRTLGELTPGQEGLLVYDFQPQPEDFGTEGRRANRRFFLQKD